MATSTNSIGKNGGIRMSRRTFTKVTALGTAAALSGISSVSAIPEEFKLFEPASAAPAPEEKLVETICPYCSVSCGIKFKVEDGEVVGIEPWENHPVNEGGVCAKGAALVQTVNSEERLKYPMVKEGGTFKRVSWDVALDTVANKLKEIKEKYGPDAVMFCGTCKNTNEEVYLLQKLARIFGTGNVDNQARKCHASTVVALGATFGRGAMTNNVPDIANSKSIFVIGNNPAEAHPVSMLWVMRAKEKGAVVISADPRFTRTTSKADLHLQLRPGTNTALVLGMIHVIINEGLYDEKYVNERTIGFDELKEYIKDWTPDKAAEITWVPKEKIIEAARLLAANRPGCVMYSMGVTQFINATQGIRAIAIMQLLLGNVGVPGGGVNAMRGHDNVQGACDVGMLPGTLPGYVKIADEEKRKAVAKVWGLDDLPETTIKSTAYTHYIALQAAVDGKLKAWVNVGENPLVTSANQPKVRRAFEALEFSVVIDQFHTETVDYADVVLPACSLAEKDGSVTGTGRNVQWRFKAVEPKWESKPDWWIICELAKRMGLGAYFNFNSPEEVLTEVTKVSPIHRGHLPDRVKNDTLTVGGTCWPCPSPDHPGIKIMYNLNEKDDFTTPEKKGLITAPRLDPKAPLPPMVEPPESPVSTPDLYKEYPLILTTGRVVVHFHGGGQTRNTPILNELQPEAYVEINPIKAKELGIAKGDWTIVESVRGSIRIKAKVTEGVPEHTIFIPFHWGAKSLSPGPSANELTDDRLDPYAKIHTTKVCLARIKKA